jgi:hypothetical protein
MMAIHREGHKGELEYGIDTHLAIAQGNNIWVAGWNSHHVQIKTLYFGEIL